MHSQLFYTHIHAHKQYNHKFNFNEVILYFFSLIPWTSVSASKYPKFTSLVSFIKILLHDYIMIDEIDVHLSSYENSFCSSVTISMIECYGPTASHKDTPNYTPTHDA